MVKFDMAFISPTNACSSNTRSAWFLKITNHTFTALKTPTDPRFRFVEMPCMLLPLLASLAILDRSFPSWVRPLRFPWLASFALP
jgi:hypothetical protein